MALTYKIKSWDEDSGNVLVGFAVTDDSDDSVFIIDKSVTKGSKTDAVISQEAYTASQTEVNAWVASKSNVGKTFDPSNNTLS